MSSAAPGDAGAPLTAETAVRRAREVDFRRIEDGVYFLRLADETREVAGVAAVLWRLFDGERSLGEIAAEVATLYEVDFDRVLHDVVEFSDDLLRSGFLTRVRG